MSSLNLETVMKGVDGSENITVIITGKFTLDYLISVNIFHNIKYHQPQNRKINPGYHTILYIVH